MAISTHETLQGLVDQKVQAGATEAEAIIELYSIVDDMMTHNKLIKALEEYDSGVKGHVLDDQFTKNLQAEIQSELAHNSRT